jgi:branched-subunit amino acid aminotransferase/4-amino-4-deoxychorismate lyase
MYSMAFVILNHELVEAKKAMVSVQDRGFRFGDGLFETLRVHAGVPYQFDWHMKRLAAGLKAIHISFDTASLKKSCKILLSKNEEKDCLLRIQITRGVGSRGYLPAEHNSPTLVIETMPLPPLHVTPISLWLSQFEKISPKALPVQYKLCQGLSSTLARIEASEHQCFEALLLNSEKHICETSSGNIFWLREDTLYTPALDCGILEGSVRAALLRLSPYPVQEVRVGVDALAQAEAVCIGNAAWKLLSVEALQPTRIHWQSGALAMHLNTLLDSDISADAHTHGGFWKSA